MDKDKILKDIEFYESLVKKIRQNFKLAFGREFKKTKGATFSITIKDICGDNIRGYEKKIKDLKEELEIVDYKEQILNFMEENAIPFEIFLKLTKEAYE